MGAQSPQCYGMETASSGAKIWVFLRAEERRRPRRLYTREKEKRVSQARDEREWQFVRAKPARTLALRRIEPRPEFCNAPTQWRFLFV